MNYFNFAFLLAMFLIWPAFAMNDEDIKFPNLQEIVNGLNGNPIQIQNQSFIIEKQPILNYQNEKVVWITLQSYPTFSEEKSARYYSGNFEKPINDFYKTIPRQYYDNHSYSFTASFKIFYSSGRTNMENLTIKFCKSEKREGSIQRKFVVLDSQLNSLEIILTTPERKRAYDLAPKLLASGSTEIVKFLSGFQYDIQAPEKQVALFNGKEFYIDDSWIQYLRSLASTYSPSLSSISLVKINEIIQGKTNSKVRGMYRLTMIDPSTNQISIKEFKLTFFID